jgi:hypothetical protein
MVELMTSSTTTPTKSCQSGGRPSPLASAMDITAAPSITHDSGFHMKPKNFQILLSWREGIKQESFKHTMLATS